MQGLDRLRCKCQTIQSKVFVFTDFSGLGQLMDETCQRMLVLQMADVGKRAGAGPTASHLLYHHLRAATLNQICCTRFCSV